MNIQIINPNDCTRWQYADRPYFEFGNLGVLAEDIKNNGQFEPVAVRLASKGDHKYELITGSRRWKACRDGGLQLKAIIVDYDDNAAAIAQIRENEKQALSDYSKGISYSRLIESKTFTHGELAAVLHMGRTKLHNFLAFAKVPEKIWQAVSNMAKVSSKSAATIYAISRKGEEYKKALIEISEEIRNGAGHAKIEKLVNNIILGELKVEEKEKLITLSNGQVMGVWKKNGIVFTKDARIDKDKLTKALIQYFNMAS